MDSHASSRPPTGSIPTGDDARLDKEFALKYPLRILIADDNYINRRVLSMLLQRFGYEAEATESGRDCLNAVLKQPCDLLLLDIDMPDMNGIECAEQIRRAKLDFPIVAVTATEPEVSRRQSFAAGMNGFITKPVRVAELRQALLEASLVRERKAEEAKPTSAAPTERLPKVERAPRLDLGFQC